jgi:hypothetical protein
MLLLSNSENIFSSIIRISYENSENLNKLISLITAHIELSRNRFLETNKPSVFSNISSEAITPSGLLKVLCGDSLAQRYSLILNSELPSPAYKERAFALKASIIDNAGAKVTLKKTEEFEIKLFSVENPPNSLQFNSAGEKILRGQLHVESSSKVLFSKIFINEVSSHFRNAVFFLVIVPRDIGLIQPLIIPDIIVKARKMVPSSKEKKVKLNAEE